MPRIRVEHVITAPAGEVWRHVADIPSHVEWMADATAIRFTDDRRLGVGSVFDCDTRVGPFRVTDRLEVTEWRAGQSLGVRHVGVVSGEGRFTLRRTGDGRTRLAWEERLRFPLWLGGPVGGLAATPILRRIWRSNLRRLGRRIETEGS